MGRPWSSADPPPPYNPRTSMKTGETLGPYRIAAKPGEGGMGEVYRATDVRLKRDVAVKVRPADVVGDAERLARFQRDVVPTGAAEPRRVEGNGLTFVGARWLPDNRRLIVSGFEDGGRSRLYLYDLDQGRPTAITPEGVSWWVVSPDGSMVAARGPGRTIRLYALDGSDRGDVPGQTGVEMPVGWITTGLLVMRGGDPTSPLGQIYRIDLARGSQEPWSNILPRDRAGVMVQMSFVATPDGRSQAYTWHRALSSLYLADGLG